LGRSQHVLLVDDQNNATLYDRDLDTGNYNWINKQFRFKMDQNIETTQDSFTNNQLEDNTNKQNQQQFGTKKQNE